MTRPTFHIVDVFAEEKYAGNQLAVFQNVDALSDGEMQKIAREMNFSETTFILSDRQRDGGYDVRIFTPGEEVPFAGHPTLGTAYVIARDLIEKPVDRINLNLKVGQIPVTFAKDEEREILWMKQKTPEFGPTAEAQKMAGILGLDASEIDARFPVQEVSTGLWFAIVPLVGLEAVRRARVARDAYFDFVRDRQAQGILVFCPETCDRRNDLHVRVFVPYYGIEEDPATGSGNGCLAGYLVKHRYFNAVQIDLRAEQGYEIDRPSLIYHRAQEKAGAINVHIGGRVVMVASGCFL